MGNIQTKFGKAFNNELKDFFDNIGDVIYDEFVLVCQTNQKDPDNTATEEEQKIIKSHYKRICNQYNIFVKKQLKQGCEVPKDFCVKYFNKWLKPQEEFNFLFV